MSSRLEHHPITIASEKIRCAHHPPGPRGRNCKPWTYRPPLRCIPEPSTSPLFMTPQKPPLRCDVFHPPWTYSSLLTLHFSFCICLIRSPPAPLCHLPRPSDGHE